MDQGAEALTGLAVLTPLAGAAVVGLRWGGCLRGDGLDAAPVKDWDLTPMDGLGLAVAWLVGQVGAGLALGAFGQLDATGTRMVEASPAVGAWRDVAVHLAIYLPMLAWACWRFLPQPGGWRRLGLAPGDAGLGLRCAAGFLPAAVVLVTWSSTLMIGVALLFGQPVPAVGHEALERMRQTREPAVFAGLFTQAVLIAPFMEELFYRGLLQPWIGAMVASAVMAKREAYPSPIPSTVNRNWPCVKCSYNLRGVASAGTCPECGTPIAESLATPQKPPVPPAPSPAVRLLTLVFASLLFMSAHVPVVQWQTLPGLFLLSMMLGWLYERTGSLWPGVLVHAGFNATNVLMAMYAPGP